MMERRDFLKTPALGVLLPGALSFTGLSCAPETKEKPDARKLPQRIHQDFETYIPGIEYFTIGNGDIIAALQYSPELNLEHPLTFLGLTSLASLLYPLARFFTPPGLIATAKKLVLKKTEIPPGAAREIIFQNQPVVIINRPGKGYIALSRECTHLGCLVGYSKEKNQLICPCHAGMFDLEGNVLAGPAPNPLPRFPLEVTADTVILG